MSGKWNNDQSYYRCRYPAEYALANKISHPKNVYLKEAGVLGRVDDWLAELFSPGAIDATVTQLAEQAERLEDPAAQARAEAAGRASPSVMPRSAATAPASTPGETPQSSARGSPRPRPRR
jgi:hypothetical protein